MRSPLSYIHPSLRTGLAAWLASRTLFWMLYLGGSAGPERLGHGGLDGPPLWQLLERLAALPAFGYDRTVWLVGIQELALLGSCILLYRIVRKSQLPQMAERVTWFWVLCPLFSLLMPLSAMAIAIVLVFGSVLALSSDHPFISVLTFGAALGFRPEIIIATPGWGLWFFTRFRNDLSLLSMLAGLAVPLVAFSATIGSGLWFAGDYGISLRYIAHGARWRGLSLSALPAGGISSAELIELLAASGEDLLFVGIAAATLVEFVRRSSEVPAPALVLAAPILVWPLLFESPLEVSPIYLLAFPLFAVLGRRASRRSGERLVLILFVLISIAALYPREISIP